MRRTLMTSLVLGAVGLSLVAVRAQEAPKPVALPAPDAEGFVSLFNGKDLTGWEGIEGDYWTVKDGAITGSQTLENAKHTFLILSASKAEPAKFKDFELRLKYRWMNTGRGDSGIQIRSKLIEDPRDPSNKFKVGGYQINTAPGRQYDGGFYDEANVAGQRGIMASRGVRTTWPAEGPRTTTPLAETSQQLQTYIHQPMGEFNDMVFVANGKNFSITINGKLMGELVDESPKAVLDGGLIAFQLHSGIAQTIQFKDIKIKFLK